MYKVRRKHRGEKVWRVRQELRKVSERNSLEGFGRMRRNLMQVRDGVGGGWDIK